MRVSVLKTMQLEPLGHFYRLTELRFYIPLGTKQVISEMLFAANVLVTTEKNNHKIYNKHRLTEHK